MEGLYGLPLERFTDARNQLAKDLRRSGDREAAAEVARLKKPTRAAWAINQLARADKTALRKVLETGKRLRAAQEGALGGGSGKKLRDAAAGEREAVDRATQLAAGMEGAHLTGPNLERVRSSLHAAASIDEVRDAIEAGRLTSDHEPIGLGSFTAAVTPPADDRASAPRRTPKQDAAAKKKLTEARKADGQAKRTLAAAERALESRRTAARRAQEQLSEAQAQLDEAQHAAAAARNRLEKAEASATGTGKGS